MRYTTVLSEGAVKEAGFPYSVAMINPREGVAAFRDEQAAVLFCRQLNGVVNEEAIATLGESLAERMVDSPPGRVIEVEASDKLEPDQRTLSEKIAEAQSAKS